MVEDVEVLTVNKGFPVNVLEVKNRYELLGTLAREDGIRPIIHFDCHGHEERGLYLAPDSEFCSWSELAEALRYVNSATANNLVCVFATCFGSQLMRNVSLLKITPAYAVIAPVGEIQIGDLQSVIGCFYTHLTGTQDLTLAYRSCLAHAMVYYHCQGAFFAGLVTYIRENTKGQALADRKDLLLDEALEEAGVNNPSKEQLAAMRQAIKVGLKPRTEIIDRFAQAFLMGGPAAFTFHQVLTEVNRSQS